MPLFDNSIFQAGSTHRETDCVYIRQANYVQFLFNCDLTNKYGSQAILVYRCNHMVVDVAAGHSVHDCGGTGAHKQVVR